MTRLIAFLSLLLVAAGSSGTAAQSGQPNIVILMVDDLGWNHIAASQPTGGTYPEYCQTPHIAKLANEGLSFTHAYAQPNCAPTRAAILSGQYPARPTNDVYVVGNLNRFGRGGIGKSEARFRGPEQSQDVAAGAVTLAEALQRNGYATAHIGKYHVGGHAGRQTMPENAGFDINIGGHSQGHQPVCFATEKDGAWQFRNLGLGHFDRFAAPYDAEYVRRRGLPESLVGTPKHVSDAVGDAMEETIRTLAAGEKPFYLQFHTYAVHGPVRARPDLKEAANASSKRLIEYAGFIAGVDENVGRLRRVLEDPNGDGDSSDSIAGNTLILFTSDNGGTHDSNAPLKGVKGMFTEGGIRVPLIACWPGVVPSGTVSDRKVHSVDYYPTCLELAGRQWGPSEQDHPLDGESFAHVLRQPDTAAERGPVFYLFPGYLDRRARPCVVVIDDIEGKRYKQTYDYESDTWELYCLSDDQGEQTNLIAAERTIAAALSQKIRTWLTQQHPSWQPKYPLETSSGQPAGPPPLLAATRSE
ncbi:MAG: sulfatase [Maioricimonas sp. JB049]